MKAYVDQDTCIGCGLCEETCPAVFKLDDTGKSSVIVEEVPAEFEECAEEAQDGCPVGAISVE